MDPKVASQMDPEFASKLLYDKLVHALRLSINNILFQILNQDIFATTDVTCAMVPDPHTRKFNIFDARYYQHLSYMVVMFFLLSQPNKEIRRRGFKFYYLIPGEAPIVFTLYMDPRSDLPNPILFMRRQHESYLSACRLKNYIMPKKLGRYTALSADPKDLYSLTPPQFSDFLNFRSDPEKPEFTIVTRPDHQGIVVPGLSRFHNSAHAEHPPRDIKFLIVRESGQNEEDTYWYVTLRPTELNPAAWECDTFRPILSREEWELLRRDLQALAIQGYIANELPVSVALESLPVSVPSGDLDGVEPSLLCCVCLNSYPEAIFPDCRHAPACIGCLQGFVKKECPICRKPFNQVYPVIPATAKIAFNPDGVYAYLASLPQNVDTARLMAAVHGKFAVNDKRRTKVNGWLAEEAQALAQSDAKAGGSMQPAPADEQEPQEIDMMPYVLAYLEQHHPEILAGYASVADKDDAEAESP
jgi:hypothetical protein